MERSERTSALTRTPKTRSPRQVRQHRQSYGRRLLRFMESGTSLPMQLGRSSMSLSSKRPSSNYDLYTSWPPSRDPNKLPGPGSSDSEHMANLHPNHRCGFSSKVNESSLRSHLRASACLSLLCSQMRLSTTLFPLTFSHFEVVPRLLHFSPIYSF